MSIHSLQRTSFDNAKIRINNRVTTALALRVRIRSDRGTGRTPHDRTGQHFLELRASGFSRAMKEDEPVVVLLPEEIARSFDLIVRRMAKVKAADNRANRDMRYGVAERLDGIHDSGVTATSHENTVFRQQRQSMFGGKALRRPVVNDVRNPRHYCRVPICQKNLFTLF